MDPRLCGDDVFGSIRGEVFDSAENDMFASQRTTSILLRLPPL
jgi:hypothetical protein